MSNTIVWADGTKLRSKRLIDAYNRGVLVERRPTPGGVSRWIARCEQSGCKNTYDFSEISSRRVAEARCSQHVSRKGVRGGRAFFGEIEVIGKRMREALFDGRIIAAQRTALRAVKWTIQCSVDGCKNTLRLSSTSKSSSQFQLCGPCNTQRMKKEAKKLKESGKRTSRFVWTDGSWITGQRVQEAFLAGKLVEKRGTRWRAKCEETGCTQSYDFSAVRQPQAVQQRCTLHVVKHQKGRLPRRKILIQGHWTTCHELAAYAADVVWKKRSNSFTAYVRCRGDKCESLVRFAARKNWLLCQLCAAKKRRNRPYEAIYNLWRIGQRARNKKRKTALRVEISYAQFAEFCEKNPNCFFCGKSLGRLPYVPGKALLGGKKTNVRAPYMDRIDPAKHYTMDNIVSACGPCNMSKNIFVSHTEMILLGLIRTGRWQQAQEHMAASRTEFVKWGAEVAQHSSYWAGGRKKSI